MVENPVVSGRVSPSQKRQMKELNLKVPECVEIALKVKQEKEGMKKVELLTLLNANERLSMKIVRNNERIEELKMDLNFMDYSNEQLTNKFLFNEIDKNVQAVLDRFYSSNEAQWGKSKRLLDTNIYNFFDVDRNAKYISKKAKECGLSDEEFKFEVIKRFEEQQTLI